MTPEAAAEQQIEMYRRMTGEERLRIACGLHDLACEMTRAGIRHQNPEFTPGQVEQELHRRIDLARKG